MSLLIISVFRLVQYSIKTELIEANTCKTEAFIMVTEASDLIRKPDMYKYKGFFIQWKHGTYTENS